MIFLIGQSNVTLSNKYIFEHKHIYISNQKILKSRATYIHKFYAYRIENKYSIYFLNIFSISLQTICNHGKKASW